MAAVLDKIPEWHVGKFNVTELVKDTIAEFSDDDVTGLAGEMAFRALMALAPFLLFLVGLTAILNNFFAVGDITDRLVERAEEVMPEDAAGVFGSMLDQVVESQGLGAAAFGLVAAFWAASAAIDVAIKGFNRAYDVKEDRGLIRRKAISLGLTAIFGGFILASILLITMGRIFAGAAGEAFDMEGTALTLFSWLSIPAALVLVTIAVAVLYWLAPNTGARLRLISPGAVVFVIGWVVASLIFGEYISRFGDFNETYGAIGAVIVLLLWLYWSSIVLFVGVEVNAVLARRHDDEYLDEKGERPESPAGSQAKP
jgi:membrane protein